MVQEKAQIVNDLYEILTSEPQTNRFYWNKSVGFRSELEFSRKCVKENKSVLDGGMFIFKKIFPQIACYVTVSKDSKEDYTEFYDRISKSSITKKLFFVQFKGWSENDTEINVKSGTVVTFDRNTLGTPKVNSNNPKDAAKQKKELKKIILIHVPTETYPILFETFSYLIKKSGLPNFVIQENVDFKKLYQSKFD